MQPERAFDVVVVGLSARALAAAARRAGLEALALDLFADEDTRQFAALSLTLRHGPGLKIDANDLMDRLTHYAGPHTPVVLASGFEHRPRLVEAIAARFRLAGSSPATLRKVKQPATFAALLASLAIPHPRLFDGEAPAGIPALAKRTGGAGGHHIRTAKRVRGRKYYLQERLEGRSVSVLFVGDGRSARIIGFSEQWTDPSRHSPFRYGGGVGPIRLDSQMEDEITAALSHLTTAAGLLGLASADFIVNGSSWYLIEINPRPGASLDLFDRPPWPALLRLHLDACEGKLPERAAPATLPAAHAACLLYAPCPFTMPPGALPEWASDRPLAGTVFGAGDPVCTVRAEGADAQEAREKVLSRARDLSHHLTRPHG